MTLVPTCPQCGSHLAPVSLDPDTAPWLCAVCGLGWWGAELSAAARSVWRPNHRDHGYGPESRAIRDASHVERTTARHKAHRRPA